MRAAFFALALVACRKNEPVPPAPPAPSAEVAPAPSVIPETLPRCRLEAARVPIDGDDVVLGDVAVSGAGLLVGIVRRREHGLVASVVRAGLDLASSSVVELGTSRGDDPPPRPIFHGSAAFAAVVDRARADAGTGPYRVRLLKLDTPATPLVTVTMAADDSAAFDVAWLPAAARPLFAWDEDAPPAPGALASDRGVVKVQLAQDAGKSLVVSPSTSDAESPRLLPRGPGSGFWVAWLARRPELVEDAGADIEAPAERRALRWVEAVALDATGVPVGAVRRYSSEKGRATSFEMSDTPSGLVVYVQDEATHGEGGGGHIVQASYDGERLATRDIVDAGVGHALVTLPAAPDAAPSRWLAWSDTQDHAHVVGLGGADTLEPALEGLRVVAAIPPASALVVGVRPSAEGVRAGGTGVEIRRATCAGPPSL